MDVRLNLVKSNARAKLMAIVSQSLARFRHHFDSFVQYNIFVLYKFTDKSFLLVVLKPVFS